MESTSRDRAILWAPRAAERGHELLSTGTPCEVLARIVPEDPLGLRALVAARLGKQALLCDAERVLLSAQALCALQASTWRGEPEFATWLEGRVTDALLVAIGEECAAPSGGFVEALRSFAEPLALDPCRLAAACTRFNRLPFEQREAFCALVLDADGADHCARARGLSLSELARRARAGLQLFRRPPAAAHAHLRTASAF